MSEKNGTTTSPASVYIVLPICEEQENDVFFGILKSTIARSKFNENAIYMQCGMTGEKFSVETDDLSVNWKLLTTDIQKMRQAKLLGFWAVYNYPSLGRKLFGGAWQAPKRSSVLIVGANELEEETIDGIIFQKMKLRILELTVSASTMVKLKHFVKVPATVGKYNESKISPKIKVFDIEDDFIDDCWEALKLGEFPVTENFEKRIDYSTCNQPDPSSILQINIIEDLDMPGYDIDDKVPINETHVNTNKSTTASLISDMNPTPPVGFDFNNQIEATECESSPKRPVNGVQDPLLIENISLSDVINQNVAEVNGAGNLNGAVARKRARLDVISDNDTLHLAVNEIRKEVANLTKWVHFNAGDEICAGPERLHVMIFKEKDAEIIRMKDALQSLEKESESIKTDNQHLRTEMEKQSGVINALQKGIETSAKLVDKSERDLAVNLVINEELREQLKAAGDTSRSEVELCFQNQIRDSNEMLANAERVVSELRVQIGNFEEENAEISAENLKLKEASEKSERDITASLAAIQDFQQQLQAAVDTDRIHKEAQLVLQNQNRDLHERLTEADQMRIDLTDTIGKLMQELTDAKTKLEKTEELHKEIICLKVGTTDMVSTLHVEIEKLQKQHAEITDENHQLKEQLKVLKESIATKDEPDSFNENELIENRKCMAIPSDTLNRQQECTSETLLETDGPIVNGWPENLLRCRFGWIKFYKNKNTKYPGFVNPPDADGKEKAQMVTASGHVSDAKKTFYEFHENIPDSEKENPQMTALKKLNKKFNFSFV